MSKRKAPSKWEEKLLPPVRCRHERNSWILGDDWEWCYRCGALIRLELYPVAGNALRRVKGARWVRPVGPNGENPWKLA